MSSKEWMSLVPGLGALGSRWRARRQEREAARAQAHCEMLATQRGARVLEGDALRGALRVRLAARRGQVAPVPSGNLHLFLACAINDWEWVLPRALAPFGRVTAFDWKARGYDCHSKDWVRRREDMNRDMLDAFRSAQSLQPVDAVVGILSGHNTSPETISRMADAGAVILNVCWDDKLHFPGPLVGGRHASPASIASAVDLNLTSTPSSLVKYAAFGGLAMFFPEAAHPEVHRPWDLPFEFDVSFVGGCYGPRPGFMRALERRGIRVACFGRGWPNGPLSSEDMIRLYSRSRINLGFAGIGHSMRLMHLKGRDFEVPMAAGLYLTQDNPELRLVFDVGREILTYRSADDCAARIQSILREPDAAARVRLAGRNRALRDHTYLARWSGVLEFAGLLAPS